MTTVPNELPDGSATTWLSFATSVFHEANKTWFCKSWVPWLRYILTIVVIVIAVLTIASDLSHLLPRLVR